MGASPTRTLELILAGVAIVAVACGVPGHKSEPGYKARLRGVEAELVPRNTVPRLQAWLAEREPGPIKGPLPSCIRELELGGISPWAVWEPDCGGVSVSIVRLEVFTITVCPPSKRPPIPYHEPSESQRGYLGPFGADAYISMEER